MEFQVHADAAAVARAAASILAAEARRAVTARGGFVLAVSGGRTPWMMLRALAEEDFPSQGAHIVQVDERVAPAGHPDRNLIRLRESLLHGTPQLVAWIHPMPVEAPDLEAGAQEYARTLAKIAGSPPVLDVVHLGLGTDGHTASLVPGQPVLAVTHADVAVTEAYEGRRRMTLTYPAINRSRRILWLVTGSEKAGMLARLIDGDPSIPAGRVRREGSLVIADREAAGNLEPRRPTPQ